jgi:predicted nucleotidyltransferase
MDTALRRIEEITAALQRVAAGGSPEGVLAVFLYGSALGRLFRPDSDLDVAVLDDSEHPLDWHDQAKLMDDLERATGRGVDLRLLREISPSHQAHVIEQGRMVWTRDRDEVERQTKTLLQGARQAREDSKPRWSEILERLARTAAAL